MVSGDGEQDGTATMQSHGLLEEVTQREGRTGRKGGRRGTGRKGARSFI